MLIAGAKDAEFVVRYASKGIVGRGTIMEAAPAPNVQW